MIISIASGKGGTGKTTIATNLASSMGGEVQILDCDVEEPNVHLFLKPEIEHSETAYTFIPEIDQERCSLCRLCVDVCRFNALTIVGETLLTFPQLCHSCTGCMIACPEHAIRPSRRELGAIENGFKEDMLFIQGRLRVGEAMAPPLISRVKASSNQEKAIIIDAPPGTSCPVITAIKDTDFVLMVTEPTPFGLHDLKLAVEAVKTLGIPHGLVINRSDLGDDQVAAYARSEGIPVLMEIPFNRRIAEIYSSGHLLVEVMPEWQKQFCQLFEKIKTIIH